MKQKERYYIINSKKVALIFLGTWSLLFAVAFIIFNKSVPGITLNYILIMSVWTSIMSIEWGRVPFKRGDN